MPPTCARVIGGPGSGKTTRLLEIVERATSTLGIDPFQVGFVSFTRAARREAATRAGDKFDVHGSDLEKTGWFRTLHSIAYRQIGVEAGELITGTQADNQWLMNRLNDPKAKILGTNEVEDVLGLLSRLDKDVNDDYFFAPAYGSDAGRILALWDAARNRQVKLMDVWAKSRDVDNRTPDLKVWEETVTLYEKFKKRDGRIDFCDLLMIYAGKRWTGDHKHPFEDCDPQGDVPRLPVWIHDEMQDCSLLTSLVFARLTQESTWVYLAGDRNQEIYSWAGADGSIFERYRCAKEDFLPVSHRCDKSILDVGKRIIRDPRLENFQAANAGGTCAKTDFANAVKDIKPGDDCLILGRTNQYAATAARLLDDAGIPWRPTKGGAGSSAPARAAGVAAIATLKRGGGIDGEAVHRMMGLFKVSAPDGTKLFEHGAKAYYEDKEHRDHSHKAVPITIDTLADCGCTHNFKELLVSGKYVELLEKTAAKMAESAQKYGPAAVLNPTIRIGTCHSVKGAEADHVILLNQISYPTQQSIETEEGMDAERRVWYVSATRARHKLTIAEPDDSDHGSPFPEL